MHLAHRHPELKDVSVINHALAVLVQQLFARLQPQAPCLADFCELFRCCGEAQEADAEIDEESGEVTQESLPQRSRVSLSHLAEQRRIARCRSALERCWTAPPSISDKGGTQAGSTDVAAFAIDMCIELEGRGGAGGAADRLAAKDSWTGVWGGYIVWLLLIAAAITAAMYATAAQETAMHLQPYVGQLKRGFRAVQRAVPWAHGHQKREESPVVVVGSKEAALLSARHKEALNRVKGGSMGRQAERLIQRRRGGEPPSTGDSPPQHEKPRLMHSTEFRRHDSVFLDDDHPNSATVTGKQSVDLDAHSSGEGDSDDSDGFVVPAAATQRPIAPGLWPLTAINRAPQG